MSIQCFQVLDSGRLVIFTNLQQLLKQGKTMSSDFAVILSILLVGVVDIVGTIMIEHWNFTEVCSHDIGL